MPSTLLFSPTLLLSPIVHDASQFRYTYRSCRSNAWIIIQPTRLTCCSTSAAIAVQEQAKIGAKESKGVEDLGKQPRGVRHGPPPPIFLSIAPLPWFCADHGML